MSIIKGIYFVIIIKNTVLIVLNRIHITFQLKQKSSNVLTVAKRLRWMLKIIKRVDVMSVNISKIRELNLSIITEIKN